MNFRGMKTQKYHLILKELKLFFQKDPIDNLIDNRYDTDVITFDYG